MREEFVFKESLIKEHMISSIRTNVLSVLHEIISRKEE